MDVQLVDKAFTFSRRRRKWLLSLALCGVSGYGFYRIYHLPSVSRKRKRLMKLLGAMFSVAELVYDSSETINVVSRDLNEFLRSDSDEIPNSLKQISKIARAGEFVHSLASVSEGFTLGVLRGYRFGSVDQKESVNGSSDSDFTERVMDRVFSPAGSGFISAIAGSFARNLVLGFYSDSSSRSVEGSAEANGREKGKEFSTNSLDVPWWVNALYSDKSKELIAHCIEKFVTAAVAIYLDKTMDINTYDEIFVGLTNPKHRDDTRDILVSVCNGAVETLVKTSHNVLTSPSSNTSRENGNGTGNGGWFDSVKTTLAVPSNRKFVFDVTGRATFETVRSMSEFLLLKLLDCFRRNSRAFSDEITGRGRRIVAYFGAKSSVIVTIFIAFYLHVLDTERVRVLMAV
ncbi:PREDICTED: protein PHLOEM PROTEIN 2-LIKE A10-like [Tarenaya hassleriana]|uniref:protein PHLOEM PROTEIN 2-LIKE A10-like n=1 Tax=Tarenaya hassleriana TaxID=28532 RepID=UPI00053C4A4D|nr:PREDICTED: protein PHLOEM PROTEIN 2-LIKE A10-like [Tarenaya hassleriana]